MQKGCLKSRCSRKSGQEEGRVCPARRRLFDFESFLYNWEGKENWYGLRQHYRQCVCSCIAPRMELEIPGRLFRGENIWLICKLEILRSVCKRSHLYKSYNWSALKWINFGQYWLFLSILFFFLFYFSQKTNDNDCSHYWREVSTLYWGIDELRAISSC